MHVECFLDAVEEDEVRVGQGLGVDEGEELLPFLAVVDVDRDFKVLLAAEVLLDGVVLLRVEGHLLGGVLVEGRPLGLEPLLLRLLGPRGHSSLLGSLLLLLLEWDVLVVTFGGNLGG